MIRTLSLIKRRPDLTRAAFRDHYETTHAPLALPLMSGLLRYVRYHLEEVCEGDVFFDVMSAFWYRDAQATEKLMAALASEVGRPIREDELKFMDKEANRFFPVSEQKMVSGEEGDEHLFVLLRKPEAMTRYDFAVEWTRFDAPPFLESLGQVEFALMRDFFPMEPTKSETKAPSPSELPFNSVLQVRTREAPS